jgi:hypothetical protein
MCVIEEDLMAMSLLYALLGVYNTEDLKDIETAHQRYTSVARVQNPDLVFQNEERALRYHGLQPKQKKEVMKALYDALYHMIEYSYINRTESIAIGRVLCNPLRGKPLLNPQDDPDIANLYKNLRLTVMEAIDES